MKSTDVINFWFHETSPKQWFSVEPAFDGVIRDRFGSMLDAAAQCDLFAWRETSQGRLAEIIVLDQFSRNVFRGTSRAFSQDPLALALSQVAVRAGALAELDEMERSFLLMPYMHSESPSIHAIAEPLFKEFTAETNYDFELKHKSIIDRFGRYPHRNAVLGRDSTDEELAFLEEPGSSF